MTNPTLATTPSVLHRFIRHPFAWLLALLLFTTLLYAQIFSFDYTFLDDNRLIKENFWLISSPAQIPTIFTKDIFLHAEASYYRPLFTLSFMPDALLARTPENLKPFFATNLLLHLANITLLALLLRKLKYAKYTIVALTTLFAVHPMHAQLVAWIPGRNDTLFSLFTLTSVLLWLQFLDRLRWKWLIAHSLALFLALLTKEAAVVIPVITIFLTLLWQQRKLSFLQWWLAAMSWLSVGLMWFLLRVQAVSSTSVGGPLDMLESLWRNSPAALHYLGKMLVPHELSVLAILADGNTLLGSVAALMLLIAVAFIWKYSQTPRRVLLSLAWMALFLLPGIAVHNPAVAWGQDIHLDHRAYVPMIGVLLLFAELLKTIGERRAGRQPQSAQRHTTQVLLATALLAVVLSVLTLRHTRNFSDKYAFWTQAVATSPQSPLAHRNLAAMYQLDGELERAKPLYLQALALNPEEPMAHNNLGLISEAKGELAVAEEYYRKEIALNPNFALAYGNLARLLAEKNELEEARELWLKNWQLEPQNGNPLVAYTNSFAQSDPAKFEQLKAELIAKGVSTELFADPTTLE